MNENIKFAFAVSHSNGFEACHFGDADKYLIFEMNGTQLEFKEDLLNTFKNLDEEQEHGSKKKGNAIIELLQQHNINVLVSKQFGKNIQLVNRYFIPVIIDKETKEEAIETLNRHRKWIKDELQNNHNGYKLFTIKKGILKTLIKK